MKKAIILIGLVLLVLSCTTTTDSSAGPGSEDEKRGGDAGFEEEFEPVPEVEELLEQWLRALRKEDLDLFTEAYWPQARMEVYYEDGTSDSFFSADAIRENQRRLFEEFDFEEIQLPQPIPLRRPDPRSIVYHLDYEWADEFIVFTEREGEWRIERQEFIHRTPGPWVMSKLQVPADLNRNGFIDDVEPHEEHRTLVRDVLMPLLFEPHDVRNEADELFDGNRDGFIDEREMDRARHILFFENIMFLAETDPGRVMDDYDLNGDGEVRPEEAEQVMEFMFGDPELRRPRSVESDFDRTIDMNGDGRLDEGEINDRHWHFVHMAGIRPFRDEVLMEVPREVANYLDRIADTNADGMVDERENDIFTEAMSREHQVNSPIGWKLDTNKNRFLDWPEILLARQNYALDREVELEQAQPPFAVRTALDETMDLNGNGRVEQGEIDEFVAVFASDGPVEDAPERIMDLFDRNRNGSIQPHEKEDSKWFFLFAHPVNPENSIDRELDGNGDGFIEPGEMGITAGFTDKGETAGFAERIERMRWAGEAGGEGPEVEMVRAESGGMEAGRDGESAPDGAAGTARDRDFESEYYKKLGTIQDKKLAVVGLSMGTANVNQETATGLMVFVENAFVNIGKVRVVDRKNIEQIMEEYKFQASALTDENTAVEIGKLSGADIIVIGSINYVGKMFYLNIKLINVETGEIIGSSIAEAQDESGFLDMSNKAVYNLF